MSMSETDCRKYGAVSYTHLVKGGKEDHLKIQYEEGFTYVDTEGSDLSKMCIRDSIVGADGIESDIPINLSGEEALKLKESADSLKKIIETIEL